MGAWYQCVCALLLVEVGMAGEVRLKLGGKYGEVLSTLRVEREMVFVGEGEGAELEGAVSGMSGMVAYRAG